MTDFDDQRRRQERQRRQEAADRAQERAEHRADGGEAGWSAQGSASTGLRILVIGAAVVLGGVVGLFTGPVAGLALAVVIGAGGWIGAGRIGGGSVSAVAPARLVAAHDAAVAALDAAELESDRRRTLRRDLDAARAEAMAPGGSVAAFEEQAGRLVAALPTPEQGGGGSALERSVEALEESARADAELDEALRGAAPVRAGVSSGEPG